MNILLRWAAFGGGRGGHGTVAERLLAGAQISRLSDYALTKPFAVGLARLQELGEQHQCAIMCAEAVDGGTATEQPSSRITCSATASA